VRKLIPALWLVTSLATASVWAQPLLPSEAGVTMGHWHLNSGDVDANRKIFLALGGTAFKLGTFEIVKFPGVYVYLNMPQGAPPSAGGNDGAVVNQVGVGVQSLQDTAARLKASGVQLRAGMNGRTDQAFVTTPDGLSIEIVEDKNQKVPIQHRNIQFSVPESSIPEIQAWYTKVFSAKPLRHGQNRAAEIPGANLNFVKTDRRTVTTKGRALDHIGFDVKNLEVFLNNLQANGAKLDRHYTKTPFVALAFIYDPWGTYIELNERPSYQ
jgi:catechol 2,3-dioxygenase-like lactoylglutathione lyase family enzyme/predicted enzyme related to lactoylglutathione lyase